jgi:hypothetical protein
VPHIENKDIEAASNGDRLAECSLCKSALKSPPLAAKIVSASQQKIYPFEEECTRMEASSNENKISINFTSKIINNNNSNNLIEISNNKVSNNVGVIQENANISNNLNSAQTNSIPETESNNSNSNTNANTNNTSNLNGNTAKFFKRELPKVIKSLYFIQLSHSIIFPNRLFTLHLLEKECKGMMTEGNGKVNSSLTLDKK